MSARIGPVRAVVDVDLYATGLSTTIETGVHAGSFMLCLL